MRHFLTLLTIACIFPFLSGCVTPTKIVLTPVTVVRDVVDAPLVSLTNVMEMWADKTDPFRPPDPNVSWNYKGGFNFGVGYSLGWFIFKPLSLIFGGVDYVVCRSFYPCYPAGLSPWKKKDRGWGSLYFPNTRAMWGNDPPDTIWEKKKMEGRAAGKDPPR